MRGRKAFASRSTTTAQKSLGRVNGRLCVALGVWITMFLLLPWNILYTSSRAAEGEASEHFIKFLEIPLQGESIPNKLSFPLYEQNSIRYFSAGLGKEERSLSFPPYPLKLIFVKGPRAFLTNVAIEVLQPDGTNLLSIPEEEVQGPWLFLNLPAGKYIIKATDSSGISQQKTVDLTAENTTTAYFRWP